jgi:hypothetical protein
LDRESKPGPTQWQRSSDHSTVAYSAYIRLIFIESVNKYCLNRSEHASLVKRHFAK